MILRWFPLYGVDDPPAGGGAAGADDDRHVASPDGERPRPSDVLARYGRDGDAALKMAERLSEQESANYKLREKNRQLRDEVSALRSKAAPEGAVMLDANEAAQWQAYQELGVDPPSLKAALAERDEAKGRLTALEREKIVRDVAEAAHYKPGVLGQLPGADALTFELRDTTVDGETKKAAFVKYADGQVTPLADYAQEHWADFLPALDADPQHAPVQGTTYPTQSSGGKPAVKSAAQQHIQKTKYAVPGKAP